MKRRDVRSRGHESRTLLNRRIPNATTRLPALGPYVISSRGVLRAQRDCVRQRGVWVSKNYADRERDRPTGDRRDDD